MKYIHHDLGHRSRAEIVEIILKGNAANVRLMDSSNFSSYRAGRSHRYVGGLAKKSPARLQIPHSGHWHVAVDLIGLKGSVRSSARILPGPLPALRDALLSSVPSLVRGAGNGALPGFDEGPAKSFDVFICHASEDKDDVVRDLAHALVEEKLDVWYDEFELKIGDSLRRKIDKGVANSRFGIVVLSEAFFGKGWPNYELDGLVTKGIDGKQIILPVWHNITKAQVVAYSPSLADKLARSTGSHTVEEIASEITEVIRSRTVAAVN